MSTDKIVCFDRAAHEKASQDVDGIIKEKGKCIYEMLKINEQLQNAIGRLQIQDLRIKNLIEEKDGLAKSLVSRPDNGLINIATWVPTVILVSVFTYILDKNTSDYMKIGIGALAVSSLTFSISRQF